MFKWTHTVTTTATPEQVWPLYAQVDRWLEWDSGLSGVSLNGDFQVGNSGTLAVEGQPPLTWTLTENASFTDVTEIPGVAILTFVHRIAEVDGGSAITHEVHIEGPAAEQLGPMVTSDTPEAMEALARIAAGA